MIIYIWALVQNRGRRFGLRANLYIYPECFSGDFILSNPGRFESEKKQVPLNIVFCVWSFEEVPKWHRNCTTTTHVDKVKPFLSMKVAVESDTQHGL